jgi:uncharacterized OB-fold protein
VPTRLIDDDIILRGSPPRLIGGRHKVTGKMVFPCPAGVEGARYDVQPLSPRGTLWSWTVQRFRPKTPPYAGPDAFAPYAVGYVALPDQLIVETRLEGIEFESIEIGMPLEMVLVPFNSDPDGTTVLTYAFTPAAEKP